MYFVFYDWHNFLCRCMNWMVLNNILYLHKLNYFITTNILLPTKHVHAYCICHHMLFESMVTTIWLTITKPDVRKYIYNIK